MLSSKKNVTLKDNRSFVLRAKPFIFYVTLTILLSLVVGQLHAQTLSRSDSIKNAIKVKKTTDSLNRVAQKLALKKQHDSLVTANKNKRIQDSVNRVIRKKQIQDSIALEKFRKKEGEEKYQEKLSELDRLKKQEERFNKQRQEDSVLFAKQERLRQIKDSTEAVKQKTIRDQFVKDSTAKSIIQLAEAKRIKDSLDAARKLALEKAKQEEMIRKDQERRKKDSLRLEKKLAKEKAKEEKRQLALADKQRKDSLDVMAKKQKVADQLRKDSLDLILKKQNEVEKHQKDSLDLIAKKKKQAEKDSLELIAKKQKEAEKHQKDSLDLIAKKQKEVEKHQKDSLDLIAKKQKEVEKRQKDSLNLVAKKQKEADEQRKDSLARIAAKQKDSSAVTIRVEMKAIEVTDRVKKDSVHSPSKPTLMAAEKIPINIDSLRKVDSIKYYFSTFLYRLKRSTELSFYLGVSNYLGDLGGNSGLGKRFFYDNNFKKRNNFYGASLTFTRNEYLGLRLSYMNGNVSASDQDIAFTSKTDDAYFRYKRNLDFQTKISEWSLMLEYSPLKHFPVNNRWFKYAAQPYYLFGIGRYSFNPQGSYYDDIIEDYIYVDLQPLSTEGQGMKEYPNRKPYSLKQWNIPFGLGVRYVFSRRTSLSMEFVGRKLFTDYLDDVSTNFIDPNLFSQYLNEEDAAIAREINNKSDQIDPDNVYGVNEIRGNPKSKDFYYSFNLKFAFRISKLK